MRMSILPKSLLGRWSVGLAAANILLNVLFLVLVARGGLGPGPVAPIANATTGISGIAALVTGLISMIKSKERSILVYLGMGLLVLLFLLGEFLFPHWSPSCA